MMFKVGDLVKCIKIGSKNLLVEGKNYRVIKVNPNGELLTLDGIEHRYYNFRFELATPPGPDPTTAYPDEAAIEAQKMEEQLRNERRALRNLIGDY